MAGERLEFEGKVSVTPHPKLENRFLGSHKKPCGPNRVQL